MGAIPGPAGQTARVAPTNHLGDYVQRHAIYPVTTKNHWIDKKC
jgi:hypothetical protein